MTARVATAPGLCRRPRRLVPVFLVLLLAVVALGFGAARSARVAYAEPPIDVRLRELRVTPIGGRLPRSFALLALDGRRVTLGQLTGRAAFLYFWATW